MSKNIETRGRRVASLVTHRNEFPAEYSLAGCSPAEPASASPAELILQPNHSAGKLKTSEQQVSPIGTVSRKGSVH
jgi:hypothetical protein